MGTKLPVLGSRQCDYILMCLNEATYLPDHSYTEESSSEKHSRGNKCIPTVSATQ